MQPMPGCHASKQLNLLFFFFDSFILLQVKINAFLIELHFSQKAKLDKLELSVLCAYGVEPQYL